MAIKKIQTSHGPRWVVTYRDPDKKQKERWFPTRKEAEACWHKVEVSKHQGTYIDPQAGKITFQQYAEEWRAIQVHRGDTADKVESNLRVHVYPVLGHRPMAAIRYSHVQAWVRGCTLGPRSIDVAYSYVASIFKAAVRDRIIANTPCTGVKLPEIVPEKVVPLTIEQVEMITDAMPHRYQALVQFAAGTGLRPGECFGVTMDRVNFLRKEVLVDRQLKVVRGGTAFGPPKTAASYRVVPYGQMVHDALSVHLADYPAGRGDLIFTNDDGEGIRRNRYAEMWNGVMKSIDLIGITPHDLRHFYASLLLRDTRDLKEVQARLGHKSATETLDTYGHLWQGSGDRTRDAVDNAFRRAGFTRGSEAFGS